MASTSNVFLHSHSMKCSRAMIFVSLFQRGFLQSPCMAVYTYWIWMAFREMRGADSHSNFCLPYHPLRLISVVYGGPKYHGCVSVSLQLCQYRSAQCTQHCLASPLVRYCWCRVLPICMHVLYFITQNTSLQGDEQHKLWRLLVLGQAVWNGPAS